METGINEEYEPKVFLNEYGFRITSVRVMGDGKLMWETTEEDKIARSSKEEVKMTVSVFKTASGKTVRLLDPSSGIRPGEPAQDPEPLHRAADLPGQ
jgi:hypothetical protein